MTGYLSSDRPSPYRLRLPSTLENLTFLWPQLENLHDNQPQLFNLKNIHVKLSYLRSLLENELHGTQSLISIRILTPDLFEANPIPSSIPSSVIALDWGGKCPSHVPHHVEILGLTVLDSCQIPDTVTCLFLLENVSEVELVKLMNANGSIMVIMRDIGKPMARVVSLKAMEELMECHPLTVSEMARLKHRGIRFGSDYLEAWRKRHGLSQKVVECINRIMG